MVNEVKTELLEWGNQSHWMWFVFPQLKGLGRSRMAEKYAINDIAHAKQYLDHPILGQRLRECTELVLAVENKDLHQIFGDIDSVKFISSMTLFTRAADSDDDHQLFYEALVRFNQGNYDQKTIKLFSGDIE